MQGDYNQQEVHNILNKLETSQESITSASAYFLNQGKNHGSDVMKSLVNDWNMIFSKFLNFEKMNTKILAMMYLLNDVIQNARSKQNYNCFLYLPLFQDILNLHLKSLIEQADNALKKELFKLLKIWKSRKVYPDEWLDEFLVLFKAGEEKNFEILPENLLPIPNDLITYAQSFQDYTKWKEKAEEAYSGLKSIENILMPESFDEVKADCDLANYKRCMDIQNKYRKDYLKNSEELLKNMEQSHVKMVFNLKSVCKVLYEIEVLEEEIRNVE